MPKSRGFSSLDRRFWARDTQCLIGWCLMLTLLLLFACHLVGKMVILFLTAKMRHTQHTRHPYPILQGQEVKWQDVTRGRTGIIYNKKLKAKDIVWTYPPATVTTRITFLVFFSRESRTKLCHWNPWWGGRSKIIVQKYWRKTFEKVYAPLGYVASRERWGHHWPPQSCVQDPELFNPLQQRMPFLRKHVQSVLFTNEQIVNK